MNTISKICTFLTPFVFFIGIVLETLAVMWMKYHYGNSMASILATGLIIANIVFVVILGIGASGDVEVSE